MNCARVGVENQNGCEIRTTSGTQNHHILPPSSSHPHISLQKKNEIKVMEKGKKEKKHGAIGKIEREVWSCIGWEMDQLEQKRQKTMQFGDFHAEQSSGAT
ncbi:hypothetical protein F2Q69_00040948 [Brassica cretica]|uniref:Uncharacterized protein n=1 Tax=Brassica cretica TaxID=69181 RepID=A0A8S9NCP4_BRACR|nr:hypothetical protein F2Q69_00040948 [Brassica cretica]